MTLEYLHHSELLVGDAHDAHVALGRQARLRPFYMDLCVFPAAAMPHVNAELEHLEAVVEHFFAEHGIILPVLLCFRRKIEKYQHPHDTICI